MSDLALRIGIIYFNIAQQVKMKLKSTKRKFKC